MKRLPRARPTKAMDRSYFRCLKVKRLVALAIAWSCLAGSPLFAQGSRHSLRLNGWGGFGFGYTNTESGDGQLFGSSSRDLFGEFGVEAGGFLYDPRLLNYTFSSFWDGNNTSIDQGSALSRGLSFNGSLSFIPERSFPFTFYFSRSHSSNSGSLIPPYSTNNSLWGLRGELRKPRLALISYNLGLGKSENDLPTGEAFNTKQRFANLTATRKLFGWDLQLGEDYLRSSSTFSSFLQRNNTLSFRAGRDYGGRIRVDLGASYSAFAFRNLRSGSSSDSSVTLVDGSLLWKHTEKLDSSYSFSISRNAVNALRILTSANGEPGIPLPFNAQVADTTTESFAAGANYRPTSRWSFNGHFNYSHNGLPEAALASLPPSARNAFTTSLLNLGGGYSYRRKVWKLDYHNAGSVSWQHFSLASGGDDSGVGFTLENGASGGDLRQARFSASYRYSRRSNPIFFNVVTNSDHRVNLKLETARWSMFVLQAIAEIGKGRLELAGSNLDVDVRNFMLSASRRRLTIYASHSASSSEELFFGPGSILFQPGGSTGRLALPAPLLNPLIFSDVTSDRVGVNWRPRNNLQIEGRYSRSRYDFVSLNELENRFRQFDITVQYKFGRFTMLGGYGRGSAEAARFNRHLDRVLFRVRFPFHIM